MTKGFRQWLDTVKKPIKVKSKYKLLHLTFKKPKKVVKEAANLQDFHNNLAKFAAAAHAQKKHDHYHNPVRAHEDHLNNLHNSLDRHYHDVDDLHEQEHHALAKYTAESTPLNHALINYHQNGISRHAMDEHLSNTVTHLDSALNKKRTPHDLHVYTGIGFDPHQVFKPSKARNKYHAHMPAYTSTSIDPQQARSFAIKKSHRANIIKIHVPKGSRGLYMGESFGYPDEKELVLPRNCKLRIHPVPSYRRMNASHIQGRTDGKPHKVQVWHAKLIHDGTEKTSHWKDHLDNE